MTKDNTSTDERKNPRDYFVIDTKTESNRYKGIDYTLVDLLKNEEYASLVAAEKNRTLADLHPKDSNRVNRRAANYHEESMLGPMDNTGNIHPELIVCKTEDEGYIFVKELRDAQIVLKDMRKRDTGVRLSPMGLQHESLK